MSSRRRAAGAVAGAAVAGAAAAVLESRVRAATRRESATTLPEATGTTVRSADGTALHTIALGPPDAPAVVLVHAWICSHELWHRQLTELEGEARIIAFDLRGHGRSGQSPSGDYSVGAFADDLEAVLGAQLAEGERAVLCGHSMGAMTIAAWAHERGERVQERCAAVAMVGTGLGDLVSESLVVRAPDRISSVKQRLEAALLRTELPLDASPVASVRAGARYLAFGPGARPEDVALVTRMVRECDARVRGRCGGTLARIDLLDGLSDLDVPAAVIAGERDRMTPPVHSHRLAERLPRRPEVLVAPGAGHMVPLEADAVVTAELRRLLAEVAASAAPA